MTESELCQCYGDPNRPGIGVVPCPDGLLLCSKCEKPLAKVGKITRMTEYEQARLNIEERRVEHLRDRVCAEMQKAHAFRLIAEAIKIALLAAVAVAFVFLIT